MDDRAYSVLEAAERLSLSERTLRAMIASGRVRVVRVGTRVLIPASALQELLSGEAETTTVR